MSTIYNTILVRRGLQSEFNSENPILASGEPAFATDTGIFKIGNGVTRWNNLTSFSNSNDLSSLSGILNNQIYLEIANLIDGAPLVLDTLREVAEAINNDENFAVNIFTNINTVSGIASTKVDGSGTLNYLSKWADNNTLTDSIIYDSGNTVSIGGPSTGSRLYVTSNNNIEYNSIIASGNAGQQLSFIRVSNTNNTATNSFAGIFLSATRQSSSVAQGNFIACVSTNMTTYTPNMVFGFRTGNSEFTEYMRISHSGNLGIGTNTPAHKLDVQGSGSFNGDLFITGSGNFDNGVYVDGSPVIKSDITNITGSVSGVNNIVIVDQNTYDNILTKDPNTIYYII